MHSRKLLAKEIDESQITSPFLLFLCLRSDFRLCKLKTYGKRMVMHHFSSLTCSQKSVKLFGFLCCFCFALKSLWQVQGDFFFTFKYLLLRSIEKANSLHFKFYSIEVKSRNLFVNLPSFSCKMRVYIFAFQTRIISRKCQSKQT